METFGTPPGMPYFVSSLRGRDSSVSSLGFSSEVVQLSLDPRSSRQRVVASSCSPAQDTAAPSCRLLTTELLGGSGVQPVGDTPAGASDRLPSVYGAAVAFARFLPDRPVAQLRYLPAGAATSQPLRGGPRGVGSAAPTDVAARGSSIAYTWRWRPSIPRVRYTLQIQRLGQPLRTIRSVNSTDGRILGPVWVGTQLVYAVRTSGRVRLYRYDPTTRRTVQATGPANTATFTVSAGQLVYQSATAAQLSSGRCSEGAGCRVFQTSLPRFR